MHSSGRSLAAVGATTRAAWLRVRLRASRRRVRRRCRAFTARVRGFGCPPGDLRLAYGWRRTVLLTAVALLLGGLVARALLSWAFVAVATPDPRALAAFNAAVTLFGLCAVVARRRALGRAARRRLPGWKHRLSRWLRRRWGSP